MGWFSDKCNALVDIQTGRALSGTDLEEAKRIVSGVDAATGEAVRVVTRETLQRLANRGWGVCGHDVPKKARICSKCGSRAPGGWIQCPDCGKWAGNESNFCPNCNHNLRPSERIDLAGGVWNREPGVFAQRFECGDLSHLKRSGLYVQEGSRAILMDGGKEDAVLGPGRHTPESLARAINWFGNPPPRSVVMVDSGDVAVKCTFPPELGGTLRTAEDKPVEVVAEVVVRFSRGDAGRFLENMMKDARTVGVDEVVALFYDEAFAAVKTLCAQTSVEDLVKDPERRERLEEAVERVSREALKRNGIEFVRIGFADFNCPDYEAMREKYGDLDQKRREFEFHRKMLKLVAEQETANFEAGEDHDRRVIDRDKARKAREQEMFDYAADLARDRQIGQAERAAAVEIARKAAAGDISAKDAELEMARLMEANALDMAKLEHEHGLQRTRNEFNRDEALAQARHNAQLSAMEREERVRDAKAHADVAGIEVDAAKREAEIRRIKSDAEKYEDMNDLAVLSRRNEIENAKLEGRAEILGGKSPLELMALASSDAERDKYFQMAMAQMKLDAEKDILGQKKSMSPEQLLALAAQNSPQAATALATMATAGNGAAERVVKELKDQLEKRERHDGAMMEQVAKIVTEAVKHQSTVVQAQPAQVFNK